jgi:hypothetical protein
VVSVKFVARCLEKTITIVAFYNLLKLKGVQPFLIFHRPVVRSPRFISSDRTKKI